MKKQNKYLKKLISVLMIIFLILIQNIIGQATELNKLDVDVYLMDNGDARITMFWNYFDNQGTEKYYPLSTEDKSIKDFKVEKDDVIFETLENWDVNASFEEKKYKSGIVDNGDEIELCWGISNYGQNIFKTSFIVEGMVNVLQDSQMVYYKFINSEMGDSPEEMSITIYSDKKFNYDDIKTWSFGYSGTIDIEDGKIVARSDSPMGYENHGTILIKFAEGYFNASNFYDKSFEEVRKEAFIDSDYEDIELDGTGGYSIVGVSNNSSDDFSLSFFIKILMVPLFAMMTILGVILLKNANIPKVDLGVKKSDFKDEYYRDLPYEGELEDLFFILSNLKMTEYANYITYYFLKWTKEGVIRIEEYEAGIFFKKEKDGLRLVKQPENSTPLEYKLYGFMKEAARSNNLLEENEFNKWMSRNSDRFGKFIKQLEDDSKNKLFSKGYLEEVVEDKMFIKKKRIKLTDKGNILVEHLIKFYNYLYEFSLLNERDSMNIQIWDDLLLYAAIYGITDRVKEEFNKLAPKYFEETDYNYSIIRTSMLYSNILNKSYTSAISSSASTGTGGSSSFGGGGGSTGGGSGGGTR